MTDFYLRSTELHEQFEPRACRVVRRMRSELRDDLALVEISPPLPRWVYDSSEDIESVILASRLEGASIFPLSDVGSPKYVYICRLGDETRPEGDVVASEDLDIIDWGEILNDP